MSTVVRARLLGSFELSIDGHSVDRAAFERPSGLRLLKLLLATPGHALRREEAAELLWPEADPERSAANLRKALHFARQALEAAGGQSDLVASDGEILRVGARGGPGRGFVVDVDVDRLRAAIEAVQSAKAAQPAQETGAATAKAVDARPLELLADLAGDELLPEDPYEEWLVPIRERLRQQVLQTLVAAGRLARANAWPELSRRLVDRALALEPAEEDAHRLAIELFLDGGQLHAARRQLVECARALAQAYGVEPSEDLAALITTAAASRGQASAITHELPIVGRRQELEAADPALDLVQAGRLGTIAYRAAAGVGKTRLLREVQRFGLAGGWRVAEVRGLESSPDVAFGALGSGLVEALAEVLPDDLGEPGRSALLTIAPRLRERPALAFASDAALIGALLDALRGLAAHQPLVLAVDDLQWLDQPTISLLGAAVGQLRDVPILLGATIRDAPDPIAPAVAALLDDIERGGGTVARLGPMAPREIRLVLERDLPSGRLEDDLAAEIAERAAGAPLLALEVLRTAIETGVVSRRGDTWWRHDRRVHLPVPPGVARLVESRTAKLLPQVRETLATAAELGDAVGLEVLAAAIAGDEPEAQLGGVVLEASPVLAALDAAISGGLMLERGGRYVFAHPLFRSALRSSVQPGARASMHHRVARALAGGLEPADRPAIDAAAASGRDIVAIAGHALAAAEGGLSAAIPPAIGFGFAAGTREAQLFDHAAAADTLTRALGLWDRLPPRERSAYPAAGALMQLGWSRHAREDQASATAAFRRAADVAGTDAERAGAWQAAAWMPYEHGRFDEADALLRQARELIGDPIARAGIDADRGWIVGRKGDWTAAYELLAPAVATMEHGAPPELLARSLDRLGVAMRDAIEAESAVPIFERSLRLATEIRDQRLAATARMHLAGAFRVLGRFDAATEQIDAALATCAMTGDRYIEAVTVWIAADLAHARGDLSEAVALRRRELALLDELGGNEQNQAMAHAHLAHLARHMGDLGTATAEADIARNIARHAGLAHLPEWIERALDSPRWFIEDAPRNAADPGPID